MSWDMWHVEGIGFQIETVTPKTLLRFVEKHKNTILDFYPIPAFDPDTNDYDTLSEIIADVMQGETGISFCAPGMNDDCVCPVLYCSKKPWEMKPSEKDLTLQQLVNIMQKYADEIGVSVDTDIDVVYSGQLYWKNDNSEKIWILIKFLGEDKS